MVDIKVLANEALELLDNHKKDNYRVCIAVVGPPGSGKSTIAAELCHEINDRYKQYLEARGSEPTHLAVTPHLSISATSAEEFVFDVRNISPDLAVEMDSNDGILPEFVEDTKFQPVKRKLENGDVEIIGRGGLPNAFTISSHVAPSHQDEVSIAQMVPMDGFHLSRKCLTYFHNPEEAIKRRGSPGTFDSNNFLQLCKTLAQSCLVKPGSCSTSECFNFISGTYNRKFPSIRIPGFDHSLKDPTPNQYCIDGHTRIVILEGLYLLYDKENWQEVYRVLQDTGALLVWYIDIEDSTIEERVAKRHLKSKLVNSLEQGRQKFQENDLLNARLIRENRVHSDNVTILRND